MQNGFPLGWTLVIKIASWSAALTISSSDGSSAASGIGGHHATVRSSGSLSVEAASSSEEGSFTVSPAPSGLANFMDPGSNWRSNVAKRSGCNRWHRSSGYLVLRQVVDLVYPRERRPCGLYVDEQVLGTIIGCTQPERRSVPISSITIQVFTINRAWENPLVVSTWSRVRDSSADEACLCMPPPADSVATLVCHWRSLSWQ